MRLDAFFEGTVHGRNGREGEREKEGGRGERGRRFQFLPFFQESGGQPYQPT